jgi:diaminohydroxyphosphoribosylaminopyrimidine deaminase/5-amino-6-(5-phosphoribosylamino)uracil reductase
LVEAGLEVHLGVEAERCARFYEAYHLHRRLGRPHVTLKAGMTLDGRLATRSGHSRWITGPEARAEVHRLRDRVDAIMVGVGTVLADDPSLTTRLEAGRGHDPVRVIVDTTARTPGGAQVLRQPSEAPTIIAHGPGGDEAAATLAGPGVEPIRCGLRQGRVDLEELLRGLAARGIVTLLVEGGGELHWSMLEAGLTDRVMFFVAPRLIGGSRAVPVVGGAGVAQMGDAFEIDELVARPVGRDLLLEGKLTGASTRGRG